MDLGTWGEWAGAIGTVAAVGVALWQTWREGKRHREQERKDAERLERLEVSQRRAKVSGVVVEINKTQLLPMQLGDGTVTGKNDCLVEVHNDSPAAIFGVSFNAPNCRQLAFIGTVRAEDVGVGVLSMDDLGDPPVVTAHFYDVDGNEWTTDSDGNLAPFDPDSIEIIITPSSGPA